MDKQITLRLPQELHEALKKEARDRGLDMKSLIIVYLWDYCDQRIPQLPRQSLEQQVDGFSPQSL